MKISQICFIVKLNKISKMFQFKIIIITQLTSKNNKIIIKIFFKEKINNNLIIREMNN